jgi:hypothetical protein
MKKVILVFLILQIVGYSSLMTMQKSHAEQLDFLSAALPSQIGLWTAESKDRMYDRETIFSYIDGAGEVYRAYNMRIGVFTHDRDGRAVDVGQGALYRPGWLSFWKGRFFVSIYIEKETAAAKEAISELSRVVASLELSLLSCRRKHFEPRTAHGCCPCSVPAVRKTSPFASCLLPECGEGGGSPQNLTPPLPTRGNVDGSRAARRREVVRHWAKE